MRQLVSPGDHRAGGGWEDVVAPGSSVVVRKLDLDGRSRIEYPATVRDRSPHRLVLSARWTHTGDFGDFTISAGAPVLEYFHSELWYGVIRLMDFDRELQGWYCDICVPPRVNESREGITVEYVDLDLDIFVSPQGEIQFRDYEEFEQRTLPGIGRTARWQCGRAVRHLISAVRRGLDSFSDLNSRPSEDSFGQPGQTSL